jgi:hypothetical protein
MPRDLLPIILTGTLWRTGIEVYDFFQYVEFRPDGSGVMGQGANHAIIILIVNFTYQYEDRETLKFEFYDTTHRVWGGLFYRTDENAYRKVRFQVSEGLFVPKTPFGGVEPYLYQLELDRDPFPEGYQPRKTRLQYHGWITNKLPANFEG